MHWRFIQAYVLSLCLHSMLQNIYSKFFGCYDKIIDVNHRICVIFFSSENWINVWEINYNLHVYVFITITSKHKYEPSACPQPLCILYDIASKQAKSVYGNPYLGNGLILSCCMPFTDRNKTLGMYIGNKSLWYFACASWLQCNVLTVFLRHHWYSKQWFTLGHMFACASDMYT